MHNCFQAKSAPFGLLQYDDSFVTSEANDAAQKIDPRLRPGCSLNQVFAEFESEQMHAWCAQPAGVLDLQLSLSNGSILMARTWAEPLNAKTARTGFTYFLLIIDFFHASGREKLLTQAAEQAWESICITDADLEAPGPRFVYANEGYESLTGWTEGEILGQNPRILQGPLTDRTVLARLKSNLLAGENFHGETINYRKNGEAFWLEWKISPVKDSAGKITHFIAFQRDVSETKVAQQRVQDFHSILAHELRAPLTSILGSLSLIQTFHKLENDEAAELIEIAVMSTERLIALITNLLDLGEIERGISDLKIDTVSVQELMDVAAKSLINYRSEDHVHINLNHSSAKVQADKDRIVQVLIHLISNALKYSPVDSTVTVSARENEHGKVVFEVSDKGPGISADSKLKLFTKFQRLASPDGIYRQGTGLGLSTAKAIVEQHHGKIGVNSEVGKGSCFWFELP